MLINLPVRFRWVASLLFVSGITILWIGSYRLLPRLRLGSAIIHAHDGEFLVCYESIQIPTNGPFIEVYSFDNASNKGSAAAGNSYYRFLEKYATKYPTSIRHIPIALLYLPIVAAVIWIVMTRLKSRKRKGENCLSCSYNLTGNITGSCPECGAQIPPGQAIPGVNSVSTNPANERNATVDSP